MPDDPLDRVKKLVATKAMGSPNFVKRRISISVLLRFMRHVFSPCGKRLGTFITKEEALMNGVFRSAAVNYESTERI